jgi:nitrate/nitrite transporter NarK
VARDTPEAGSHSLFEALRVPGFLMLGLIYFLIQIASYGMNFWVPHLIQTAGVKEPVIIGLISSVPYICGAICLIVIGKLSDASGERRKFLLGLLVGAALGFAGAAFFDQSVVPLMLALALIGASVLTSISTFWTLPPKLVSGAGAAAGIALINTLGQMGGIVSPVMVGRVRDVTGSTTPALYAISALCVVCALLVLFALPDRLRRRDLH